MKGRGWVGCGEVEWSEIVDVLVSLIFLFLLL